MKDKLQNLAIFLLVISSILLFFLNFGLEIGDFGKEERSKQTNIIFSSSAKLEDALMPKSIAINFGGEKHTVIYNSKEKNLWTEASLVLKQVFDFSGKKITSADELSEEIFHKLFGQKSIYMIFDKNISTLTLLNSFGIKESKEIVTYFDNIDSMYISLEKDYVVVSQDGNYTLISMENLDTEGLKNIMSTIYLEDYTPYYLSDMDMGGEKIFLIPQITNQKIEKIRFKNLLESLEEQKIENIIYNFFGKELNYVREIKEEGVQTIYIDENKILKITETGLLSYYDPEIPIMGERNLFISLKSALSFISSNLGFDSSVYLKEIKPVEIKGIEGFKIIFGKNTENFKVELEDKKIVDYIEIDVFNEHIYRYSQFFRGKIDEVNKEYFELNEKQEIGPVIRRNIGKINQIISKDSPLKYNEILRKIENVKIIYTDRGDNEPLGLKWSITIEGKDFLFDIETE